MRPHSSDPLDELRNTDPAASSRPPSDSRARVWARVQEVTTMAEMSETGTTRRWGWVLGAAAVGVAAVAAVAVLVNGGGEAPPPGDEPGTAIGSCVEQYSAEALASRDFAFDGTVTSLDGDQATFTVNEAFSGDFADGASVTLTATGMTGTSVTSAAGATLVSGQRYLVAGDEDFAWACGFTQPYDEQLAAEWAEAAR